MRSSTLHHHAPSPWVQGKPDPAMCTAVQGSTLMLASADLTVLPGPIDPPACQLQLLPSPGYALASTSSMTGTADRPASLNITLRDAFGNQQLVGRPGQVGPAKKTNVIQGRSILNKNHVRHHISSPKGLGSEGSICREDCR